MTAWRTVPVCQADTTKGSTENDHGATSQSVAAAVIPEQPPADRSPRTFAASIKQLFREVKQALTASIRPAPEPKKRTRRGSEEGRCGFRLAAGILRRIARSIFHGGDCPWEPPCELDDAQQLGLPVKEVIVLTNAKNLSSVASVPVRTLGLTRNNVGWLNERDLFWGLPRSGMSIASNDCFSAIGGVPYCISGRMAAKRIGIRENRAEAFVEAALDINKAFFALHESQLGREIFLTDVPRLAFLRTIVPHDRCIRQFIEGLQHSKTARDQVFEGV